MDGRRALWGLDLSRSIGLRLSRTARPVKRAAPKRLTLGVPETTEPGSAPKLLCAVGWKVGLCDSIGGGRTGGERSEVRPQR